MKMRAVEKTKGKSACARLNPPLVVKSLAASTPIKNFRKMRPGIVFEDIKAERYGVAVDARQAVGIEMKMGERELQRGGPGGCGR